MLLPQSVQFPTRSATECREATRTKLAAALGGQAAAVPALRVVPAQAAAPAQAANEPTAAPLAANPAHLLLQARTVREFGKAYELLHPGRDECRGARVAFWVARVGDVPLAELSHEHVDAVMTELETVPGPKGRLRSGATINRFRMALASIIKFARTRRRLPRGWVSPLADLPLHPETSGAGRSLTLDEEKRLMAAAATQVWPLLPLVIRIALTTALRRSNVAGLRWENVDFDAGTITIERDTGASDGRLRTKNGEAHVSPMTRDVAAALQAIRPARALPQHCVFPSPSNAHKPRNFNHLWLKALQEAGIEAFRFHDLRHSSCSRLAAAGASALEIAEHSGHKSLRMVQRYSHLNVAARARKVAEVFAA